ncbi:MAG: CxxxxCH/CxxCH domain-containing protein [Deltaproteobacteria bacterium]|nr:CxxxxCH/CxxCH domain-containing protein [Deltaproteobacteria bacterium]
MTMVRIRVLVIATLFATGACSKLVEVPGSSCAANDDCSAYPSCARRLDACVCKDRACYFDPDAPVVDEATNDQLIGCRECHGSTRNAAPPVSTAGDLDTAALGVGAHQTHLIGGNHSRSVSCTECHVVPRATNAAGHIDSPLPAEVTFGDLANGGGRTVAAWDRLSGTCSGYCHGAAMRFGPTYGRPIWTVVDGTQAQCGTCHDVPPPTPHPSSTECSLCHLPTAGPNQTIANRDTHVDGVLQVTGGSCNTCHGNAQNAAPPADLDPDPNDVTTEIGVGAHQTHLAGGAASRPTGCSECHVVPQQVDEPEHIDSATPDRAEMSFGPTATAGLMSPVWDRGSATCSNTYCHAGRDRNGTATGRKPTPVWTEVGAGEAACGACHGLPPNTPTHAGIGATDCSVCHLPSAGPNSTIAAREHHVDGILDASSEPCNACHGDATGAAPPKDLNGDSAPTDPEVGAHQRHMAGGDVSSPVPCDTCHLVPQNVGDPNHNDTPTPAEITFSGRAVAMNDSPSWDHATRTCAGTHCHGANSSIGLQPVLDATGAQLWNPAPVWNEPAAVACGSCHGLPPSPPHPQTKRCGICHQPTVASTFDYGNPTTAASPGVGDRTRHVDGVVDVDRTVVCTACHGTAGVNAAPPSSLTGNTGSADPKVGAHQAHLAGGQHSKAVDCAECHIVPTQYTDAGHMTDGDDVAELTWGALASTGVSPTRTGAQCRNYCHGATLTGGNPQSPSFNSGPITSCSNCHGAPPTTPYHASATATTCDKCHETAGPGGTVADRSRHVDGVVQAAAACSACHGDASRPSSTANAPPMDLQGLAASSKVGAHLAHLSPTNSAPAACDACHVVPLTMDDSGHRDSDNVAEVTFHGRAIAASGPAIGYTAATLTCANTYCHGVITAGGTNNDLAVWDAGGAASACDACHGVPPPTSGHGAVIAATPCGGCHTDTASSTAATTIKAPQYHVDGVVQVSACGAACHEVPPTTGAHGMHAQTLGFACATCHGHNGSGPTHNQTGCTAAGCAIPSANVDMVFDLTRTFPGGTSMRNGGTPAYARSTKTCQVGCHNPVPGKPPETPNLSRQVTWTTTGLSCTGCHDEIGTALPRSHALGTPIASSCSGCHAPTGHTAGAVVLKDPDPSDAHTPSLADKEALCKTCHDGGAGTYFGGQTAVNVLVGWTSSSHASQGLKCLTCHITHVSTPNTTAKMVDRTKTGCNATACHADKTNAGGPFTLAGSHHKVDEGVAGVSLTCSNCHNPHLSQAPPLAAVNPDNRWQLFNLPATAATRKINSGGNYSGFCLSCHDASPPAGVTGALDLRSTMNGGAEVTQFKDGGAALHREQHGGWNCVSCHDWHGSTGTSGTNRGRLLLPFLTVNAFPYNGKNNCSMPSASFGRTFIGTFYSYTSFSCH